MNGRRWTPSHTATLCVRVGMGWTDDRIAKELGFARETVNGRRRLLGLTRRADRSNIRPCAQSPYWDFYSPPPAPQTTGSLAATSHHL